MTDSASNAGAEWILRTMVAMAAVDGTPDAKEIGLIQQIYHDHSGKEVSAEDIAQMARDTLSDADFMAELSAAAKGLDAETKEEIIRSAYLVLLSDGVVDGSERKKLQDISMALRVPEIHFGAILEDLAMWLSGKNR